MKLHKKDLTETQRKLFFLEATDSEKEAKKISIELNDFYKIIYSKKKTLIELTRFNFKPLYYKIRIKLLNINNKKYEDLNFGFKSLYRFRHIESFFKNDLKIIYEFGSGQSTIVIARLLQQQFIKTGVKGKLYTFDQSEQWINQLNNSFPKDLLEFVEFNYTELDYYKHNDYRLLKYKITNYHNNIDLVYIDGPTHQLFNGLPEKNRYQANGNIVEMMGLKNFKVAFTDKRFNYFKVVKDNNREDNFSIKLDLLNKSIIILQR
jgi:hypothetical protein